MPNAHIMGTTHLQPHGLIATDMAGFSFSWWQPKSLMVKLREGSLETERNIEYVEFLVILGTEDDK